MVSAPKTSTLAGQLRTGVVARREPLETRAGEASVWRRLAGAASELAKERRAGVLVVTLEPAVGHVGPPAEELVEQVGRRARDREHARLVLRRAEPRERPVVRLGSRGGRPSAAMVMAPTLQVSRRAVPSSSRSSRSLARAELDVRADAVSAVAAAERPRERAPRATGRCPGSGPRRARARGPHRPVVRAPRRRQRRARRGRCSRAPRARDLPPVPSRRDGTGAA